MEEVAKIAARPDVNPKEGEHKYGNVNFADEKNKKYPLDTAEHVRAALRYIGMPKNRAKYSAGDLSVIEAKIHAAAKKFGIDTEEKKSSFQFFADVVKAYEENGEMFVEGEASGPEIDQDGEKMSVSAIKSMQNGVDSGLVREDGSLTDVPLVDAHMPDGVLRELGEIKAADLTEANHLAIKAQLDKDNPAAVSLFKQLQKGKQYGLSVAGYVTKADRQFDESLDKYVKTYLEIALQEISVTTKPSWAESWVSAVSKSYISQNIMSETQDTLLETSQAEVTPETEPLVEEKSTEAVKAEAEVSKAGKKISADTMSKLQEAHDHVAKAKDSLMSLMIGNDGDADDGASAGEDLTPAEESKSHLVDVSPEIAELRKSLDEMKKSYEEKVDELEKQIAFLKNQPLDPKGHAVVEKDKKVLVDASRLGEVEKTEETEELEQKYIAEGKSQYQAWLLAHRQSSLVNS